MQVARFGTLVAVLTALQTLAALQVNEHCTSNSTAAVWIKSNEVYVSQNGDGRESHAKKAWIAFLLANRYEGHVRTCPGPAFGLMKLSLSWVQLYKVGGASLIHVAQIYRLITATVPRYHPAIADNRPRNSLAILYTVNNFKAIFYNMSWRPCTVNTALELESVCGLRLSISFSSTTLRVYIDIIAILCAVSSC